MNDAVKTTLLAVQHWPVQKTLVLHPPADAALSQWLSTREACVVQPFFPDAKSYNAVPCVEDLAPDEMFDAACLLFPKNIIEGQYLIAKALQHLNPGGSFVAAANNKQGGARLKKMLQNAGLENIQDISKHKARAVQGIKPLHHVMLQDWIEKGKKRKIAQHNFITQTGIFGWDKVDKGSSLLLQHLPENLSGMGADFGCGYGLLARHVLEKNADVSMLHIADADARSVRLCAENLADFEGRFQTHWCDLTVAEKDFSDLDFIVMNPPFHEGKKTDIGTGKAFIESAAKSVKQGGRLFMVANSHLPYEDILAAAFLSHEKLVEAQGFKVFQAIR